MNAIVTETKTGHELEVRVDGAVIASFNEISNDYAYTTRSEFARLMRYNIAICDNLTEAKNKSFAEL